MLRDLLITNITGLLLVKRRVSRELTKVKSKINTFPLTLCYIPLKKTFNTFKRFFADPAKKISQHSLRALKQPSPVPNTLKGTVSPVLSRLKVVLLTLVATALFIHIVSRPQVALNLAAQVTCDLAVRQRTPSLPPHHSCRRALNTVSIVAVHFNIVSVACQVGN